MPTLEDIVKKIYLKENALDIVDLIETDELVMRLFVMVKYTESRLNNSRVFERKNLPWKYSRLHDFIKQYIEVPTYATHTEFNRYTTFSRHSKIDKEDPVLLYRIVTLPRDKQIELYNMLLTKFKTNFDYILPSKSNLNTLLDGTFFKDYMSYYQNVAKETLLLIEIEKGSKEAGANLDF